MLTTRAPSHARRAVVLMGARAGVDLSTLGVGKPGPGGAEVGVPPPSAHQAKHRASLAYAAR